MNRMYENIGWLTWNIFTDYNKSLLAKLMFLWYYPYTKQLTYMSKSICRAIIIFCSYGILEVFVLLSCDKWFCVVHKVFHVRTSSDNTTWEKRSMSNANILRLKIKASLALDLLLSNSHYFQERWNFIFNKLHKIRIRNVFLTTH